MEEKINNCLSCKHFYITWDTKFPKGCKIFGFKSASLPCLIVHQETKKTCAAFEPKIQIKGC